MSDRPIQVGDLVYVVGCHCAASTKVWVGYVRTVSALRGSINPVCWYCSGATTRGPIAEFAEGSYLPTMYLRRIPPLSELEGERTNENIREPA